MTPFDAVLGLVSIFALLVACGTAALLLMWRKEPPELSQLRRQVSALDASISDLDDRLNRWQRRDSVRHARDRKAQLAEETDDAGNGAGYDLGEYSNVKEMLRAQLPHSLMNKPRFGDGVNEP